MQEKAGEDIGILQEHSWPRWFGGSMSLFDIHQTDRMNSRNDCSVTEHHVNCPWYYYHTDHIVTVIAGAHLVSDAVTVDVCCGRNDDT